MGSLPSIALTNSRIRVSAIRLVRAKPCLPSAPHLGEVDAQALGRAVQQGESAEIAALAMPIEQSHGRSNR